MIFARTVAGDYTGKMEIRIGPLWVGPTAEKFKGLNFIDSNVKYESEQIKQIVELLGGENSSMRRFGVELTDGKKVVFEQSNGDKPLKCLLLYAKSTGIMIQNPSPTSLKDFCNSRGDHFVDAKTDIPFPNEIDIADRVPCPYCAENIKKEATVCPFCKNSVFSKNKGTNAALNIVVSIALFLFLYFVISSFVRYQAAEDYDQIMEKATQDTKKMMQELRR